MAANTPLSPSASTSRRPASSPPWGRSGTASTTPWRPAASRRSRSSGCIVRSGRPGPPHAWRFSSTSQCGTTGPVATPRWAMPPRPSTKPLLRRWPSPNIDLSTKPEQAHSAGPTGGRQISLGPKRKWGDGRTAAWATPFDRVRRRASCCQRRGCHFREAGESASAHPAGTTRTTRGTMANGQGSPREGPQHLPDQPRNRDGPTNNSELLCDAGGTAPSGEEPASPRLRLAHASAFSDLSSRSLGTGLHQHQQAVSRDRGQRLYRQSLLGEPSPLALAHAPSRQVGREETPSQPSLALSASTRETRCRRDKTPRTDSCRRSGFGSGP